MPRSKPYTKKLATMDALFLIFTGGLWSIIMLVRELYRRQ